MTTTVGARDAAWATAIHRPLTRRGHGPGLIILTEEGHGVPKDGMLDPPPAQKWAEEGFAIAAVTIGADAETVDLKQVLQNAADELDGLDVCDQKGRFGLIIYAAASSPVLSSLAKEGPIASIAAVVFFGARVDYGHGPALAHVAGSGAGQMESRTTDGKHYLYPSARPFFGVPAHTDYHAASASLAHTRTLSFLKPLLGGPYFDIEAVWEEHTQFEFGERSVEKTMATMVEQPYVNHIPTLTGGVGRERLTDFYRHHFIFSNPADTELELVSRTVGIDRVIDEFVFQCTHDRVIDWLLPGVPPTGKALTIPFTSVVNVRGDRLHHEHIAWDQATALRQLGLLPEYLPFPYAIDGHTPAEGRRFEYRVPGAGAETSAKLADEGAVESNAMFAYTTREV
ncbi:hypothetical protein VD0003_g201 [Verticillium dahliae]|nr:hypothetical protein VD0003_g201 [Verticillium dahliae]